MTEYTPGPWRAEGNTIYSDVVGRGPVANVAGSKRFPNDARLIAAAPDLLEACEWAYGELEEPDCSREDALEVLAKAIRKATE